MKVGFIGIGNMGAPMAANVLKRGYEVIVYDADVERSARYAAERHCQAARTLADLSSADVVVTMLPTGQIVRQVMLEADGKGLAAHLMRGVIVIDMSSSEPVGTRELGAALAQFGVTLIDAPVSGGVPRAINGTLAIMIGGDSKDAVARAKPVLSAMGDRLFEVGGLGAGHAMKALNNYVAAAGYAAASEALLIGQRFGLDPSAMIDIMNVSTGRNFSTEATMKENVIGRKFATGFQLGLLAKDVRIASELGKAVKLDAPVSRLITERYALARDRIGATHDNSEAIMGWNDDLP